MKLNKELLDEEDDLTMAPGASGGGADLYDDDGGEDAVFDNDEGDDEGADDVPETDPPPVRQSAPAWDPDQFAQVLAKHMAPLTQQREPQRKEMSEEEFRQATKYYAVQKERAATLFSPDAPIEEKMQALQEMLDGSATHAVAVAGLMQQRLSREVDGRYQPLLQSQQKQQFDNFVRKVTSSSPALKGKEQLVHMVMTQMAQSGYRSTGSESKDVENVLRQLKGALRAVDPNFKLTRNVSGGGRAGMPKQAQSVNGAGGRYNGKGGGGAKQPAFAELYAKPKTT